LTATPSSGTGGRGPTPSESFRLTSPPTTPKSAPTSVMTLRGQVDDGVESGCTILRSDNGVVYLLLGGDRGVLIAGGRVEVVGTPQPGLLTTCQQGTPFEVASARRI
jgi:hypothetical protein